jgi:hypothetical protein
MTDQQSQHRGVNVMADAHKLPQVLRVVGDYLDRKEASAFTVLCLAICCLSRMKRGAVIK